MTEGHEKAKELPHGWIKLKLGEIVEFEYGKSLTKSSRNGDGKFPVYGSSGIVGYHDEYLIEAPVLIIGRKGAVGEVWFSEKNCWAIDTTYSVKVPKLLLVKFFFFLLKHLHLHQYDRSTAIPGLNRNDAYDLDIKIPPLLEQKRIVEKLEELFSDLDNGVESLKKAQKQLKIYRQAVLKWAFEGKLTEEWRKQNSNLPTAKDLLYQIKAERENRYQQQLAEWEKAVKDWEANGKPGRKPTKPSKPKELSTLTEKGLADLTLLPEHWQWIQLGEVLDDIEAGKSFKCEERPPKLGEVGVAKVSAVTWGEYDELESKTCLEESKINKSLLIYPANFLFSRANTIELVGACTITKNVTLKVMLSDKTLRFRFPKEINQKFILYFLRSRYGRNEIERLSTGNQESMRNIGQDRIRNIRTAFPGVFEQEKIVQEIESRLSICDRLEETITTNLKKAEALRQSILKQAFAGKLVPQDPNDEPAEKLLERIRAERQQTQQTQPPKQLKIKGILENGGSHELENWRSPTTLQRDYPGSWARTATDLSSKPISSSCH